ELGSFPAVLGLAASATFPLGFCSQRNFSSWVQMYICAPDRQHASPNTVEYHTLRINFLFS
ncbi:hypothetical protein ACPWML_26000, partial [Pandoraea pneumonica]|uniref:hypothetical protein n=1 Tax=Pandoraea pneumonica TaxID=2508299 RepID=UPI003CF9BC62